MSHEHTTLLKRAVAAISRIAGVHCRLFPNEVGTAWQGRSQHVAKDGMIAVKKGDVIIRAARRVPYGLLVGSGDRIGYTTITITADHVGQRIAVFTSAEGKVGDDRLRPEQRQWHANVQAAGGISVEVREPEDLVRAVMRAAVPRSAG